MLKLRKWNRELTGKSSGAQGGSAHGAIRRPRPVSAGGPTPSRGGQRRQSARLRCPTPQPHAGCNKCSGSDRRGDNGPGWVPHPFHHHQARSARRTHRNGFPRRLPLSRRAAHLRRSAAGRAQFSPAGSSRGQAPRAGWRGSIRLRQCLQGAASPSFAAPAL